MKLSKDFLFKLIWEEKWLLCCSCNSDKNKILSHLHDISKAPGDLSRKCHNFILLGDFNNKPEEKNRSNFLNTYNLKNIVKQKTCFKNPDRPTCIDLILTNSSRTFQDTYAVETGLSDFHKLVVTVLKYTQGRIQNEHVSSASFNVKKYRPPWLTEREKFWFSMS